MVKDDTEISQLHPSQHPCPYTLSTVYMTRNGRHNTVVSSFSVHHCRTHWYKLAAKHDHNADRDVSHFIVSNAAHRMLYIDGRVTCDDRHT